MTSKDNIHFELLLTRKSVFDNNGNVLGSVRDVAIDNGIIVGCVRTR